MKHLNIKDIKPKEIISLSESTNDKMVYITFLVSLCSGIPWNCGGSICGFEEVNFSMWVDENSGGGGGGNGGNGGGGGNGTGGSGSGEGSDEGSSNNPNPQIITTPVHGLPLVTNPCNKVKKQFTKFPALKQSLLNLATTTSQTTENAIFIDNSATSATQNPVQLIPTGATGLININPNPAIPYLMIAHIHNSPAISTYSVPSFEDMITIADLGSANHLDGNFVFYTITADDTRYAITVEDSQSFTDFFYSPKDLPDEAFDWERAKRYFKIAEKYYLFKDDDPDYKPLILENNPDYTTDLKNFLKFIKDAKLRTTVFKVSPDFNTFTKVTLSSNNNTIQYEDCN